MGNIKFLRITPLFFVLILFSFNSGNKVWDNPFFELEVPATWEKNPMPFELDKPARERDNVIEYYDVRHLPDPKDRNVTGRSVTIRTFQCLNEGELNYKDFIRYDNTESKSDFNINNKKAHERLREYKLREHESSEMSNWYNAQWHIQGEKRVYRISFGTRDRDFLMDNLDTMRKAVKSFREKL